MLTHTTISNINKSSLMLPLTIVVISLLCFVFGDSVEQLFIFDHAKIANGQWWRLFTGHILHTNLNHLLLNLAAVILLWFLHHRFYHTKELIGLLFFSALFISLGLYYFSTLSYYVGLSGVLHGLFVWGACKDIQTNEKTGYLLLIGVLVKIIHEQIFGASAEVAAIINADVAIDAHLYGAIAGGLYFSFYYYFQRYLNRK